jgi:hypothetical protein
MSHFREPLKRRTAAVLRENNPPLGLRKKSGMDVIKNDYLKIQRVCPGRHDSVSVKSDVRNFRERRCWAIYGGKHGNWLESATDLYLEVRT